MTRLPLFARDVALLDASCPLPVDAPFTLDLARQQGVSPNQITALIRAGLVRRVAKAVYAAAQLPDSRELRLAVLRLLVPAEAVVTDTTAAWLWAGEQVLAPGEHRELRSPQAFHRRQHQRLRHPALASGSRLVMTKDVCELDGVLVTTPLRTAVDAARLLTPDHALATLDGLARHAELDRGELCAELPRFRGYRGIIQARALAPLLDARAESFGESALRLRWVQTPGLPPPELQIPIERRGGGWFYLDLGVRELRYACEYDGEEWHGASRIADDQSRRLEISADHDWIVDVVTRVNVFGRAQDAPYVLLDGVERARRRLARPLSG